MKKLALIVALVCWSIPATADNVTQQFCKALAIDVQKEQRRWLKLQGQVVEMDFAYKHSPSSPALAALADARNRLAKYAISITDNAVFWAAYCKN
tara:strand:- start:41 stop:325 length:285 start_codon:yes stop_codon:yes gene_type:complete